MANIVRAKEPSNLGQINLDAIGTKNTNKYYNNFL